jgi:carbonic anhydrase
MSVIDQALKSNEQYAKAYDPRLGAGPPRPAIAVVTCMDPRLSDLEGILGLKRADMDVIRNGGPAVTDEVLAELVVSTRVLGSKEIMLLNHTGCGFTTFTDEELNVKLSKLTGDASPVPMRFLSYKDPAGHTQEQIKKGEGASLDRQGSACARLCFRRRHWAASGSHHRRSVKRRSIKDDCISDSEFPPRKVACAQRRCNRGDRDCDLVAQTFRLTDR